MAGVSDMPIEVNTGFVCGSKLAVEDIPQKFRGSRVRWVIHPDKTESGTCEDCREMAGQFFSIEEITGLQPLHPNGVCGFELEPAPGVESNYSARQYTPELWNRAVEVKRKAFQSGHEH